VASDEIRLGELFSELKGLDWSIVSGPRPRDAPHLAIAVHPDFEYSAVYRRGKGYVVAAGLLESVAAKCRWSGVREVARFKGASLEKLLARHPFIDSRFDMVLVITSPWKRHRLACTRPLATGTTTTSRARSTPRCPLPGRRQGMLHEECRTFRRPARLRRQSKNSLSTCVPTVRCCTTSRLGILTLTAGAATTHTLPGHSAMVHPPRPRWVSRACAGSDQARALDSFLG